MIIVNLYNFINIIIFPLYLILLVYRFIVNKETISSIIERLAFAPKKRRNGKLVWVHAASVGESVVAITLVQAIKPAYPGVNFLITTGTLSSYNILEKSLTDEIDHQLIPIDNIILVKKFLNHWQPDLGIFIESELWPCLISQSAKVCKLLLVNGRLSDKSFNTWMKQKKLFQYIAQCFSKIMVQSEKDLSKYIELGYKDAKNLGNIKFSNKQLQVNIADIESISTVAQNKKIFVAASTHQEDEEVVLKMILNFKKERIDYYPIIILRHPGRREEISDRCGQMGLTFSLRSNLSIPNMHDDLYIVDTFRELGLFYSVAAITFIGGSFKQGGHSILEPAFFNNAILFGPDMSNFQNIAEEMIYKKAAIQITDHAELEQQVRFLLDEDEANLREQMGQNAKQYVDNHKMVLDKYMSNIKNYLE